MSVVTVLVGDNQMSIRARRAALLDASAAGADADAVARYDLADPDAATAFNTALVTLPLFAGPRYLEASPVALLTEQTAALLARLPTTDTVVLFGDKAPTGALLQMTGGTVEQHKSPTGAGLRAVCEALAAEHQVHLTAAQVNTISDRCAGDAGRLQSLLYSLALTAQTNPSDALIDQYLTGAVPAPGTPWALTDQLAAGRIGAALLVADTVEPLPALSYIATRLGQMGRILEDNLTRPEQAAGAVGLASAAAARSLIDLATRIGPRGLAASWDVVTRADIAAKSSNHPRAVLELALCDLHRAWSAQRRPQ